MYIKDELKLEASILPSTVKDPVKWQSSDESVLSVDKEGNIVAKKAGKAVIEATCDDMKCEIEIVVKKRSLMSQLFQKK